MDEEFKEYHGAATEYYSRLMTFYKMLTTEEERLIQKDTDVIFFEFPEGKYSIQFGELKKEFDKELITLKNIHTTDDE